MKSKIKIDAKVRILEAVGYMQGKYENEIGIVLNIKDDGYTLVQYPNGTKLSIPTANLTIL